MTNSEIFRQPLCLVDSGLDGKMTVDEQVLSQLMNLDKEVVVVSIAGPYRTGKSYLMNKLAGQNKGFALGSTVQSKTKGIWIWVRSHPIQANKYLVLLDTEGLGDVHKGNEGHDNQILCLSILLASTLIFNDKSVIHDDAIRKLHFVTELSKHIQTRSGGSVDEKSDDSNFDFYFPDFVFAIRDFELDLEIDGMEVTADEYLEHSLTMKEGKSEEVKNFNKIRSCIRKYFKKRKCFTFERPIHGKCKDLDKVTDDELLPAFKKETEDFLNRIFSESPVKEVGGKRLSGRMLASLVETYVDQMRTGVPHVDNAVETMALKENGRARDEATAHYYDLMLQSVKMPVDDDAEFSRCHNKCLKDAINLFLSKAIFDDNQAFQRQMNELIEQKYNELLQLNEISCRERCQIALIRLYESIKENIKAGKYARSGGFKLYKTDIGDFEETYKRETGRIGIKMRHVLQEFLHSKQSEVDAILKGDERVTEAEKRQEEARQQTIEAQRLIEEANRAIALLELRLEEQQQAHKENIESLMKNMEEQQEAAKKHLDEVLDHRLKEQQRLLKEGFKKDADKMQAAIDESKREINESKREINESKRQLEKSMLEIENSKSLNEKSKLELDISSQLNDTKRQLDESKRLIEEYKRQLEDSKSQLEKSMLKIENSKSPIEKSKLEIEISQGQLNDAKRQAEESKRLMNEYKRQLDEYKRKKKGGPCIIA